MSAHPLQPYPSPEELERRTRSLTRHVGTTILQYGSSREGRPLLAAIRPGDPNEGSLLCAGNIHGIEFVSALLALEVAALLFAEPGLLGRGALPTLICIPTLNPDGYARTWSQNGRGSLKELRTNARGVDLNRNFPIPAPHRVSNLPGASSSRPGAANYRGPSPLSEPESHALSRLIGQHRCRASVSCHSFMGRFIPPKTTSAQDYRNYQSLCRAAAATQPSTRYRTLASRTLDVFTGELEDYLHHHHRAWAVCFESFPITASLRQHLRAPSLFWRFNPRQPGPWIDNDVPAILEFYRRSLTLVPPGTR